MRRYVPIVCLALLLLWGITGCALQQGESAALSERWYRVSLHISDTLIWFDVPVPLRLPQSAEVVVRVRDAQGQPVDGIAVMFSVEPSWTQHASLTLLRRPHATGKRVPSFKPARLAWFPS